MLFPLYLSSTRLFSFPPTIYLSSCTVPLFSFLTSSSFPLLPLPPPSLSIPLFPSSVSTPHLLRYLSQFFSPPILIPPFLPLMSTVYFHHLASSLSLLSLFLFPRPAPCLLSSTFNFARGRRRKGGEGGGKKRRPFVYVLQVSRIYVFCIWYFSLRVHLMHPSSGRERCHFGIFVFHLLPSPFESRPITFISIRDPSHFFRPFHGRLFVEAVDSRVQNLIIENPDFPMK